MSGNALTSLTLTEIAKRISKHLRQQEMEQRAEADHKRAIDGKDHSLSHWSSAGAFQAGAYVGVVYVSYQGATNLTRAEALHYLAGLDAGFKGRHAEYFRQSPPPEPDAPDVRFVALCKGRYNYYLYAVTKRTDTRMYGYSLTPNAYAPSFIDRRQALKLQATEDDLRRVNNAKALRDRKIAEANKEFHATLDEICGKGES